MPAIPPPAPPLSRSPRFDLDHKPALVVMPDGTPVDGRETPAIARWTALKLIVVVERYPFEWAEDRAVHLPAARALAATLAAVARWKFLHLHAGGTSPPAGQPYSKAQLMSELKRVVLQRFDANRPAPLVVARTGHRDDVQYEWSLVASDTYALVYAHDTPANRKKMDALFDACRRSHAGAVVARLGHGFDGVVSSAIAGVRFRWGLAAGFHDHDGKMLTPPWRVHVGRMWIDVPEAGRRAAAIAKAKSSIARVDEHGLLFEMRPPTSATDRSKPRLDLWRASAAAEKAIRKMVNDAFHDPKRRRELAGSLRTALRPGRR